MTTITGESILVNAILDVINGDSYVGHLSPSFLDVNISDELIFLNSGYSLRIKPATLTGNRSLTLPDIGGEIVLEGGDQDLTNKTYKARLGSAGSPSYGFDSLPGTGMYYDGLGTNLYFSVNSSEKLRITSSSIITAEAIEAPNGLVNVPAYSFLSNRDCGIYYESKAIRVSCAIDGVRKLAIGASNTIHDNINFFSSGSAAAPSIAFVSTPPANTTGLFYRATSILGFSSAGSEIANINPAGLEMGVGYIIEADDGNNEAAPSITFTGDNKTGIYRTTPANELSFTVDGTRRGFFSTSQLRLTVPIRTDDGSVSTPAYSFASDTDCGMFRSGTNEITLAANGAARMRITSTAVNIPYSGGGTQMAFDRSDGGISAGTLRVDSSNNFRLTASSGGASILLDPSATGFVRTDRYFASDLAYTGLTGAFKDLEVRSDGIFAYNSSSARYKGDVKEYKRGLEDLLKIQPKTYKYSKNKNVEFEEVRGRKRAKITISDIPAEEYEKSPKQVGLLAEDLHDAGLVEYVDYDDDGMPDGVRYKELVLLCINAIRDLAKKIR